MKCRRQNSALIVHLNGIKYGPRPFVAIKITWCNHFKVSHKLMRAWAKKPLVLSMCEYRWLSSSTPLPSPPSLSSLSEHSQVSIRFSSFLFNISIILVVVLLLLLLCYNSVRPFQTVCQQNLSVPMKIVTRLNFKLILQRVSFSFSQNNWDQKSHL